MVTFIKILLCIALVTGLTGAGFSQDKSNLPEREQFQFSSHFFDANKQKMLGNYTEAKALYEKCLGIDPKSAATYFELANIAAIQGQYSEALLYSETAAKINKDNIWYQILLSGLYQKSGMMDKSAAVLKKLTKTHPENMDVFYELASVYSVLGKSKDAIKVLDAIEAKTGVSEAVSFEKEKIYVNQGNVQKAKEEVQKLIDNFPREPRYYGMIAELFIAEKQYNKAIETYKKILEIDKNNGLVHLSLAEFYRIAGEYEKSFDELKQAFASANVDVDIKVKMLMSFYDFSGQSQELNEQAYTLLNILLEAHPDDPKAHTIYADYLVKDKQYEQARNELRLVVNTEKDKYLIWEQLLFIENELRDFKALYDESAEAVEYFPNQPMIYLFKGIASSELKKYSEAIDALKTGVAFVIDNDKLKAQFYTLIGEAGYKSKSYAESDKAFDKLLKLEPGNKYVLNNYSYYLSLRGDSLLKAEQMGKKCVNMEPNNATYLDTYAWALYRLGKLAEARTNIEKAIENGGIKNAVVIEHYGDILFKLGEKERALEQWKKAQQTGKGSEFLDKKVTEGKLIDQ